jgi:hypothetical protein
MGDELTREPNETEAGDRAQTSGADAAALPAGQGDGGPVVEDATAHAGRDERVSHEEGASSGASMAGSTEHRGAGYGGPETPEPGASPGAV